MSEYTEIEGIDDEGIDDEGIDDEGIQIDIIDTWSKYYQDKYAKEFSEIQKNTKIEKPAYPVNVKINGKVSLWKGDITRLQVDAIVNAANRSLLGGGGVDGCIHRAAGSGLLKECRKLNGCDTGDAKITLGYKLPAKYVIHTVGPIGKNKKALKNCYKNCLRLALAKEVRTLAFCCISTGIYGYPNRDAAEVALKTTRKWLEDKSNANAIDRIIFCLFLDKDIKIYHTLMLKYFPPEELKKPAKKTAEETTEVPAKPEKVKSTEIKESGEKELRVDDAKKRDKSEKNVDKKENKEMETDPDEERKTVEEMQKRRNEEDKASADKASAEEASAEEASAEEASAEEARAEEDRAEEARAEEASAEEASAEEVSAEEASAEEASAEKASAEEVSAEEVSAEEVSAKEASAEKASAEEASAEIPINPPKKQKQDDKINNETKDQEDVEMIEEDSQGREEQNTDDKKQVEKMQIQDEKMDVKDLPKQNTDEKDEQMRDQENKVYETVV